MKRIFMLTGILFFIFMASLTAEPLKTVKIINPNGGEKYFKGADIKIKWQCSPAEASGRIFLTRKKGGEVETIQNFTLNAAMNSIHELIWKIPSSYPDGGDYKIGVEVKYGKMTRIDLSDNFFSINALEAVTEVEAPRRFARIRVITPNGGETIYKGSSFTVEWETPDAIGRPKLALIDGASTVFDILGILPEGPFAGNRYRYNLEIPIEIPNSSNYKLKIFAADMFGSDESDRTFTITNQKIEVTSPVEGQTVRRGGSVTIRFTATNITQNLKVWVEGLHPSYTIAENLPPSTTSVIWNDVPVVEGAIPGGDSVKVVVSTMDLSVKGISGWLILID